MTATLTEKTSYTKEHFQRALAKSFDGATGQDRETLAYVMDNATYQMDTVFMCDIVAADEKTTYNFTGSPRVMDYPGTIGLIGAHEVRHAMLNAAEHVTGTRNVHHYKNMALEILQEMVPIKHYAQELSLKLRRQDRDSTVTALFKGAAYWTLHTVSTLLSPISMTAHYLSRIEEKDCDTFAIQKFPDTDLQEFRKMLYIERKGGTENVERTTARNAGLSNFSLWLGDVFSAASHPHPERRYRHLQALQKKTAAMAAAASLTVS